MKIIFVILLTLWSNFCYGDSSGTLKYLKNELAAVQRAQHKILGFLADKNIHIGQLPVKSMKSTDLDDIRSRITISTDENNIECRVSLAKAPVGAKCVAPCGCTGSQKWIQFSEFNKLRRNDPAQWIFCPSCQQKFIVNEFANFGGLKANLVGLALNNMPLVRLSVFLASITVGMMLSVHKILLRLLTSHVFWQAWPSWMTFVRLPLPIKFMGLKYLLEVGFSKYLALEKTTLKAWLINEETRLIDENLPVEGQSESVVATTAVAGSKGETADESEENSTEEENDNNDDFNSEDVTPGNTDEPEKADVYVSTTDNSDDLEEDTNDTEDDSEEDLEDEDTAE